MKKINKLIVFSVISLLTSGVISCSSPQDLREKRPTITGYSHKSLDDYSNCVFDGWTREPTLKGVLSQTSAQHSTLSLEGRYGGTVLVVDVERADGQTRFTLYRSERLGFYESVVNDCKY